VTGAREAKVTRSALLRLTHRLGQVDKGAALLEKKRDSLVGELFARVHPSLDARRRIDAQAAIAWRAIVDALAACGGADLAALGWPSRELWVDVADVENAGVGRGSASGRLERAPTLVRSVAARAWVPGQFDPAAQAAAQAFERLLDLVLETAPEEAAIRKLGRELAHTVRKVNVLEQRVAVDLRDALVRVRRTLDEREREEATRLRRIAAHRHGGSRGPAS
jgi:V/A-type H+-transporting ATPase subunit D